ncbi:hypothetical protein DFAR_3820008 [Desulfarculales bacterium]
MDKQAGLGRYLPGLVHPQGTQRAALKAQLFEKLGMARQNIR